MKFEREDLWQRVKSVFHFIDQALHARKSCNVEKEQGIQKDCHAKMGATLFVGKKGQDHRGGGGKMQLSKKKKKGRENSDNLGRCLQKWREGAKSLQELPLDGDVVNRQEGSIRVSEMNVRLNG